MRFLLVLQAFVLSGNLAIVQSQARVRGMYSFVRLKTMQTELAPCTWNL